MSYHMLCLNVKAVVGAAGDSVGTQGGALALNQHPI